MEITKQQYEYALDRIEELLPMVSEDASPYDKHTIELAKVSDIVEEYEKTHFPINRPK